MQLHLSALRNNSRRGLAVLGPDTGFDSIADLPIAAPLNAFLNSLDATNDYWRIGNLGHAAFVGIVDELRWYHRRMSDVEVLELYQAAAAVSPRGSLTTTWGKLKSTR